ncbi:MAG: type II toxin-antitoxin system RelB/DinJ family antitoxin [Treponema sp.]|nr:type II toxin-antitoxin system RelB/DinJ family antitoxin [Treponema sp.]
MTSLSIRMEDETKAGFDKFCDEIGLSVSSVFNMFAKKVVREQRIPFEINANPFYSEENMKFLRESIAQDKSSKTKSIPMNELEAMAESK